jgi:hypothetical protein
MTTCAYCERINVKITKEHLFPACLHQRIAEANKRLFEEEQFFYLSKIDKLISSEPKVKDVCSECNNGVLSELDNYACLQWDKFFHKILEREERITFEYNYNLLLRWLLKMSYNSARVQNSGTKQLGICKDYILGKSGKPDNVVLHLQLTYPSELTEQDKTFVKEKGLLKIIRYEPRLNRVGHVIYMTSKGYGRVIRAIYLQSYVFLIHLFPTSVSIQERNSNLRDFQKKLYYAKRLEESSSSCSVVCNGLSAKETLESHYKNKELFR